MGEKDLRKIVNPQLGDFDSFDEYYESISNARDVCDERGYHRVDSEPENDEECIICYDCDLWFDKGFAKSCGIEYRVEKI